MNAELKHDQEVRWAAEAGMPPEDFKEIVRKILKVLVSPHISDEMLKPDYKPPERKPLSSEQALSHLKGAMYVSHRQKQLDKARARAEEAAIEKKKVKEEDAKSFDEHNAFLRDSSAKKKIAKLKTRLLGSVILLGIIGEIHLICTTVSDWLGIEGNGIAVQGVLGSISAVFLGFLAILAEESFNTSRPKWLRAGCGSLLVVIALLLGFMRSASSGAEGWVLFAFMTILSVGAPVMIAYYGKSFWERFEQWLTFDAAQEFFARRHARTQTALARLDAIINSSEAIEESYVEELTEAYDEYNNQGKRDADEGRETARLIDAEVERHVLRLLSLTQARSGVASKSGFQVPGGLVGILIGAVVLLLVLSSVGCAGQSQGSTPNSVVLLCDRSSSGGNISCSEDVVMDAFRMWASEAVMAYAGEFTVLIIDRDHTNVEMFSHVGAPSKRDLARPLSRGRERWISQKLTELAAKRLPTKERWEAASGVIEAIYAAGSRMAGLLGEKKIIVASDLRQVTPGKWDCERHIPEQDEFLRWLKTFPTKPQIDGIELSVCGFHSKAPSGNGLTLKDYLRLRQLWRATFAYWGKPGTEIMEECRFD